MARTTTVRGTHPKFGTQIIVVDDTHPLARSSEFVVVPDAPPLQPLTPHEAEQRVVALVAELEDVREQLRASERELASKREQLALAVAGSSKRGARVT